MFLILQALFFLKRGIILLDAYMALILLWLYYVGHIHDQPPS